MDLAYHQFPAELGLGKGSTSDPSSTSAFDHLRRARVHSVEIINDHPSTRDSEATLQPGGLFGRNPDGVMRQLYQELCRFAHGHPGHTNADIWGSNGPVFVPEAFTQFWRDYRDTFLACAILLKIAYPPMEQPDDLQEVARHAGTPWNGLAATAVAAYFP